MGMHQYLAVVLALLVNSPAAAQEVTKDKDGWWSSPAGLKFRVHTPASVKGRPGLVFLLHGSKGYYKTVEKEFKDPCLKAGFVVVVPRSSRYEDPKAPDKRWRDGDYAKLETLTRELMSLYSVDRTRIYMVGLGDGVRGGNLVFRRPKLYAGFVAIMGGPSMIPDDLTEKQKREMGIYYITRTKDKYKESSTDPSYRKAKEAGIEDIVYKEYPDLSSYCPNGCSKDVVKWLGKKRKTFVSGSCPELTWVTEQSDPARWRLIYFYSTSDEYEEACRILEWDWLADPKMVEAMKEVDCVRVDLATKGSVAADLKIKKSAVVLVSPDGEVKMRVKASQILSLRRRTSKMSTDVLMQYRQHRASRDALMRKVEKVLKRTR